MIEFLNSGFFTLLNWIKCESASVKAWSDGELCNSDRVQFVHNLTVNSFNDSHDKLDYIWCSKCWILWGDSFNGTV